MIIPFRPKHKLKDRIKDSLLKILDSLTISYHKLPGRRYVSFYIRQKTSKYARLSKYFTEDLAFELQKFSRHTELFLFSLIILISVLILFSYDGGDLLTALIAVLMLVLIVVIYSQMKLQKRMMRQYVPVLEFVRIRKCQLYSDKIRVINIYGAINKLHEIGMIRNVVIGYDVVNDSYSPVSIEGASLAIKLKNGPRIHSPMSTSILDVQPKKTSGTEVSFRLKKAIKFDSIEWLELKLMGNASKKLRIKPHLYVNIMIRGDKPKFIMEPFDKFKKRPEMKKI